jgi:uncharacterized protein (TIGR03067 family)
MHDDTIEGTWLAVSGELGGKAFPDALLRTLKLVVAGDAYTVTVGHAVDRGTLALDATPSPKRLDVHGTEGPNRGKTLLAIYERSGDLLRICYDLTGRSRPTEFDTIEGAPTFLVTYRRQS